MAIYNWSLNSHPPAPKEKTHFFSSSESEEEEDHRKKFKIKIKPLPADANFAAPSVDELKASIGNLALSPSPLVSPAYVTHASRAYDVISCHFFFLKLNIAENILPCVYGLVFWTYLDIPYIKNYCESTMVEWCLLYRVQWG